MNQNSNPQATDLPNELLSDIVQTAAKSGQKTCYNLALTSRAFHSWAQPFICWNVNLDRFFLNKFEQSVIKKIHAHDHPDTNARSISFNDVPVSILSCIILQCSPKITSFSIYARYPVPAPYFRTGITLYSRYLEKVCLIQDGSICDNLPDRTLARLTHLITFTEYKDASSYSGPWSALNQASNPRSTWNPFQCLTHVAIPIKDFGFVSGLLEVATHLRCFVILEPYPEEVGQWPHGQLIDEMKASGDRRLVSVMKTKSMNLTLITQDGQDEFWNNVGRLVKNGYMSEGGDKWE